MINSNTNSQVSAAENYIADLLSRQVPYKIDILGNEFIIKDHNAYPPGKLTRMFGEFIIENKICKGKVVADIGAGSFALGIIAAKNGAKQVIGTDFTSDILETARENIKHNNMDESIISLYPGDSVYALLPQFERKLDVIFCGIPWDSISQSEFDKIPDYRKQLSYAFYDIEDKLIKGIMRDGFKLLSENGRMFITNAQSHIERIDKLCREHNLTYRTVKAEDIHKNGNIHFILELVQEE